MFSFLTSCNGMAKTVSFLSWKETSSHSLTPYRNRKTQDAGSQSWRGGSFARTVMPSWMSSTQLDPSPASLCGRSFIQLFQMMCDTGTCQASQVLCKNSLASFQYVHFSVLLTYYISGNIGNELSLAVWRRGLNRQIKFCQYLVALVIFACQVGPTTKLNSAIIFLSLVWNQITKFNAHQYFHLYGIAVVCQYMYTITLEIFTINNLWLKQTVKIKKVEKFNLNSFLLQQSCKTISNHLQASTCIQLQLYNKQC